jgi:hypothetical protein
MKTKKAPPMHDLEGQEFLPGLKPKETEERKIVAEADHGWCRVTREAWLEFDEDRQDWKPSGSPPSYTVTMNPETHHQVQFHLPFFDGLNVDQLCKLSDSIKQNMDYLKGVAKSIEEQLEAALKNKPQRLGHEYVVFRSVRTKISFRLRTDHDDEDA